MKKYVSEFIASLLFTFIGVGTASLLITLGQATLFTGVSLVIGLTFTVMYYVFGRISGSHINPAISVGMLINGKMTVSDFVGYIVAQFAGAFAGCGALILIFNNCKNLVDNDLIAALKSQSANHYGDLSVVGTGMWAAVIIEIIVSFVVVIAYMGSKSNKKTAPLTGLIVGLSITLTSLFTIALTGAAANPAKSLATAVFAGKDSLVQVWVFIVAPLVGGAIAALVWSMLNSDSSNGISDDDFDDEEYAEEIELVEDKADESSDF